MWGDFGTYCGSPHQKIVYSSYSQKGRYSKGHKQTFVLVSIQSLSKWWGSVFIFKCSIKVIFHKFRYVIFSCNIDYKNLCSNGLEIMLHILCEGYRVIHGHGITHTTSFLNYYFSNPTRLTLAREYLPLLFPFPIRINSDCCHPLKSKLHLNL